MKTQITKLSAWLALFVVSGFVVCPTFVRAELGVSAAPASQLGHGNGILTKPSLEFATTTIVKGHVVKSLPNSQNRLLLSAPTPCKVGDLFPDGSVVQTGKEPSSFAEIQWGASPCKKTSRLWADSTIRIFCGKSGNMDTVCLAKGAVVFRKDRRESSDNYYYVETKLLQARIHGTVVRVHTGPELDGIMVLEGSPVQVTNKETGSIVQLTPGVELQVKARGSFKSKDARFEIPELVSLDPEKNNIASTAADYRLHPNKGELLLEDRASSVIAYTANSKAVLGDPLLKGFADIPAIESFDLIQDAMKSVPSSNDMANLVGDLINYGRPDKLISNPKVLRISRVPDSSYAIGHNVGEQGEGKPIELPPTDHHPAARLEFDVNHYGPVCNARPAVSSPSMPVFGLHVLPEAEGDSLLQDPNPTEPDQMALKHGNCDSKPN